ncbi:MAG: hypothetical protein ACYCYK_14065 [Candidatus Dormibacteria bacterium]
MSDNPVRDGYATLRCQLCGKPLSGRGGKRWCSTVCRQRAWRLAKAAPVAPKVVAKSDTVYECDECEARYLGEQRCPDCNIWCLICGRSAVAYAEHLDHALQITRMIARYVPEGR